MFHVKHPQGESSAHTCVSITEPQDVGHEVSKHNQGFQAKMRLHIFIWKPQGVGI